MSVTPFQAVNYANIFPAQFKTAEFVRDGLAFGHATESGTVGLREGINIISTPATIKDHRNRDLTDSYLVKIEIPFLQTTLPEYRNGYFLSKGFVNWRFTDVALNVWNFIKNTASGTSPNGSQNTSFGFKASIDTKKRANTWMAQVVMTRQELEWMYGHRTVVAATTSGGSAIPMAAMSYQYSNFIPSNFTDIIVNGNSVGVFGDPKVEISTISQHQDFRQREINKKLHIASEFVMLQVAANDLLAGSGASQQDNASIEFDLQNGDIVKFLNGAVSVSPAFTINEKDMYVTVKLEGDVPYNNSESAPEYIDIGVTASNIWQFNFV